MRIINWVGGLVFDTTHGARDTFASLCELPKPSFFYAASNQIFIISGMVFILFKCKRGARLGRNQVKREV